MIFLASRTRFFVRIDVYGNLRGPKAETMAMAHTHDSYELQLSVA